jgi:heat-inducible transcriptional repressor
MLAQRDIDILRAVVATYVRDGVPVGSRRLKERMGLPVSTATIRNIMAMLERGGYLMKPHTSAGRVPTDEGYRIYVDRIDENLAVGESFASAFRGELREGHVDVGEVLASTSRILGALSRNFAMVYGSVTTESRVERIQLIALQGPRVLVVVTLSPDYERTVVLRLERKFDADVVSRAQHWINHLVTGRTLEEAKEALDSAVRDNVTDEGIIARELAVHREDIFSGPPALELYFEEREHVLGQPEFTDPKLLHVLLRILQHKEYLASLLSDRLGEEVRVTIGHENSDEELRPFSVITTGYRMGTSRGVLGVIGPTRMHYELVHALVRAASRELGAVGEEYFT